MLLKKLSFLKNLKNKLFLNVIYNFFNENNFKLKFNSKITFNVSI